MASVYTTSIQLNDFIGDSLDRINSNFSNLATVACNLSGSLTGVTQLAVEQILEGINITTNPVPSLSATGQGNVTLSYNECPQWHIGLSGLPLNQEVGDSRVSQQQAYAANFFKHLRDTIEFNPPMLSGVSVALTQNTISVIAEGGVMMGDGRVYCVRRDPSGGSTTQAAIFDPTTNRFQSGAGSPSTTNSVWGYGATLMADGRVLIPPTNQTSAQIYNPSTNLMSVAGGSWSSQGVDVFYGCTLLSDGRVYVNANKTTNSSNVSLSSIIYNPVSNTTTFTPPVSGGSGSCVLLADGRVYRIPGYYTPTTRRAQIYDPSTNTYSYALGLYPVTTRGFHLGQLMKDGRIFIAPTDPSCGGARIYDPFATTDETALVATTTSNFYTGAFIDIYYGGSTLLPDGRVLLVPWQADKAIIYDPITNTTVSITVPNVNVGGLLSRYAGAFLLKDGRVFAVPYGTGRNGILITTYQQKNFDFAALSGPHFNKTY